ncbi:MAG TPA: ABC transporter ATP-binding protein [Methylomirabilota bacterium]
MASDAPLLSVENLSVEFRTRDGVVKALDHVTFEIRRGETVGVVGESGSGKSVTAFSIMRILDPAARITRGRAIFDGVDLLAARESELESRRGRDLSMIFQNPRTALNPIRQVGRQIGDVLLRHAGVRRGEVRSRAVELLARVQIPDPERRYWAYPFELSGGMCQRVMIALALACGPALLVADEPTTGLDVTAQSAIMDLIDELAQEKQMATLLITHDLGLAAEHCERIVVMHAGHVVESAPTAELFANPRHPYTAKLIAATPRRGVSLDELAAIPGGLPDLRGALPACRYSSRCERYAPFCEEPLRVQEPAQGHTVACWKPL